MDEKVKEIRQRWTFKNASDEDRYGGSPFSFIVVFEDIDYLLSLLAEKEKEIEELKKGRSHS